MFRYAVSAVCWTYGIAGLLALAAWGLSHLDLFDYDEPDDMTEFPPLPSNVAPHVFGRPRR